MHTSASGTAAAFLLSFSREVLGLVVHLQAEVTDFSLG